MGAVLRRFAWGLAAMAWVVLAAQQLGQRAIAEREPITPELLATLSLPGRLVPLGSRYVHVVERGSRGSPVVLVHGLGGSTIDFEEQILPALARKHRVVALDLYGFGYSSHDDTFRYDLPLWSKQLRGVMDALGIKKATLVGQSLGAAVAARFAATNRSRVTQLVLLSPLDPAHWTAPIALAHLMTLPVVGEVLVSQLDHVTRDVEYSARHHTRARHTAAVAGTRRALLRCLRKPPAIAKLPEDYRRVHAQTLVVRGDEDALVSAEVPRAVVRELRGAMATHVPGAGHVLTRDAPEAVIELITRFAAFSAERPAGVVPLQPPTATGVAAPQPR